MIILAIGLLLELVTHNLDLEKKTNAEKVSEISGVRILSCNWSPNHQVFSFFFTFFFFKSHLIHFCF